MTLRSRAWARKTVVLGVVLGLAASGATAATAADGHGANTLGALSSEVAGSAGTSSSPAVAGSAAPHNIYVVALHGDKNYPPFSIPAVRDAAQAAADYWVDQSNGAIASFKVAGADMMLRQNPCVAINDTSSWPAEEWVEASKEFPGVDFNADGNHLVLVVPPDCRRDGSVIATRGESLASGGKALVGGVDAQTLAGALGTNLSLGKTAHTFERGGELVEKWHLGFFGPQSYSFDDAGPGAVEVGLQDQLGVLPAGQLERIGGEKTTTLKPVTQKSGVRGATFVDPVSGDDVYVEYRDGKGRDAGTAYTQSTPGVNLDEIVPWQVQRDCEKEHGADSSSCATTHVFKPGVRVYHVDNEHNVTTIGLPRGLASQGTLQQGDVLTGPGGGYTVAVTTLASGAATVDVRVVKSSIDPDPVDPGPVDPEPVDPAPVDPVPGDPKPVDPAPVESGDLAEASIVARASTSTYGTPAKLAVSVDAAVATEGDIVVLDGSKRLATATLHAGAADVTLPAALDVGTHLLTVSYAGSDTVAAAETEAVVRVKKAKPTVVAKAPTVIRGKRPKVRIAVDSALVPAGRIAVFLDGKKRKTLTLKKGKANYRLPKKLGVGRHKLKLRFLGDEGFKKSTVTTTIRVWRSAATVKSFAAGTKRVKARSVYRDTVRLSTRGVLQRKTAKGWKRVAKVRAGKSTVKLRAGKKGSVRKYRVVIKNRGHVKGVRTKVLKLRAR